MSGMVRGLETHTRATEIGKLTRQTTAPAAASNDCKGTGIQAAKSPTAKDPAAERRFKCHRLGSRSLSPNRLKYLCFFRVSRSGIQRLMISFGMATDRRMNGCGSEADLKSKVEAFHGWTAIKKTKSTKAGEEKMKLGKVENRETKI